MRAKSVSRCFQFTTADGRSSEDAKGFYDAKIWEMVLVPEPNLKILKLVLALPNDSMIVETPSHIGAGHNIGPLCRQQGAIAHGGQKVEHVPGCCVFVVCLLFVCGLFVVCLWLLFHCAKAVKQWQSSPFFRSREAADEGRSVSPKTRNVTLGHPAHKPVLSRLDLSDRQS